jgi:hypothetical protein
MVPSPPQGSIRWAATTRTGGCRPETAAAPLQGACCYDAGDAGVTIVTSSSHACRQGAWPSRDFTGNARFGPSFFTTHQDYRTPVGRLQYVRSSMHSAPANASMTCKTSIAHTSHRTFLFVSFETN